VAQPPLSLTMCKRYRPGLRADGRHPAGAGLLEMRSVHSGDCGSRPFWRVHMTKAKIKRLVDAVIEAARKNGAPMVEVDIDGTTVRIPLAPDKPLADPGEIVL
jgi:hypothetical protein